jgi:molecular chaperone DnaK
VRNKADGQVHAVEKMLKDLGDKVDAGERGRVESALSDVRTALKSDDKSVIEKKTEALMQAAQGIAQKAYAEAGAAGAGAPGADAGAGGASASAGAGAKGGKDDVVDAEFEEVKDKDRKAS